MLDDIDMKIIELLRENSRLTNVEIAKKIKKSETTVRQRIMKLVDRNIVKKFSIDVNPIIFGYNTIAFVGINTNPSKLFKVVRSLKKIKDINTVATTTGAYMILCQIWTESGIHLGEIVEKIEEIDGVKEVYYSIVQEYHKD
ncbi:MAG: Lrp/AsnC family transcriptional regulator [Asgard group archaeon]|nr:Lrp/AsnC family transcriptional regulator [Asgard group archaeon]